MIDGGTFVTHCESALCFLFIKILIHMRYNTKLNVKRKEIETMKLGIVED